MQVQHAALQAFVGLLALPAATHPGSPSLAERQGHVSRQLDALCASTLRRQQDRSLALRMLSATAPLVDAAWLATAAWPAYEALMGDEDMLVREVGGLWRMTVCVCVYVCMYCLLCRRLTVSRSGHACRQLAHATRSRRVWIQPRQPLAKPLAYELCTAYMQTSKWAGAMRTTIGPHGIASRARQRDSGQSSQQDEVRLQAVCDVGLQGPLRGYTSVWNQALQKLPLSQ